MSNKVIELYQPKRTDRHVSVKNTLDDFVKFCENQAQKPIEPKLDGSRGILKLDEMYERAVTGSKSAQKFIAGLNLLLKAEECLQAGDNSSAVQLFNESFKRWDLLPVTPCTLEAVNAAALEILDQNPRDTVALWVVLRYQAAMKYDVHQLVILTVI